MKKNGLMSGMIIGGILGITASVLGMRKLKERAGKKAEEDSQADNIQLKPKSEEEQKTSGMSEDTASKPGSEETAEKTGSLAVESRDTEREEQMKENQEGNSMVEDIAAKINFSQKINQLEEALKKLREENMQ